VIDNIENLLGNNPLTIINKNNFQKVCIEIERKHLESGESAQDCARCHLNPIKFNAASPAFDD
jgi:hypothetical protein